VQGSHLLRTRPGTPDPLLMVTATFTATYRSHSQTQPGQPLEPPAGSGQLWTGRVL